MLEGGRVATVARRLLYYAGDHIVNPELFTAVDSMKNPYRLTVCY